MSDLACYVTTKDGVERRLAPANVRAESAAPGGFTVADVELPSDAGGLAVLAPGMSPCPFHGHPFCPTCVGIVGTFLRSRAWEGA